MSSAKYRLTQRQADARRDYATNRPATPPGTFRFVRYFSGGAIVETEGQEVQAIGITNGMLKSGQVVPVIRSGNQYWLGGVGRG
jgi:hypothetical protein